MSVDRQHFHETVWSMPHWRCPRCKNGTLNELVSQRVEVWPHWSKRDRDEDWWEPEHSTHRFSAQMKCNNTQCGECVFVVGEFSPAYQGDDEEGSHYANEFQPKAVFPPVPAFKIQPDWPTEVVEEIELSFAAIWSDPAAAVNHLRTTVERLLDHFGVKKTTLVLKGTKKRRIRLPTHDRIVAFSKTNAKAGALFEAVKWLGNAGSHADLGILSRSDVLDGMEIMEHALHELFDKSGAKVLKLAKGIIKKKGPLVAGKKAKGKK